MSENIKVLIPEEELDRRIREIADNISEDFKGEDIHLICILKGSLLFTADLAKRIKNPVTYDFLQVGSYGSGTESTGQIMMKKDLDDSIEGKNVIIVEDIIDSGRTLDFLLAMLQRRNPKTLNICTLLDKPERRVIDVPVKYTGFIIPDKFVVGYGMDYDQKYRALPYIGVYEP